MNPILLCQRVSEVRQRYVDQLNGVSEVDAVWKPSAEEWNLIEITEHLFWAEQGGIFGMWKTLYEIRQGKIERKIASINQNLPIESVIQKTWKEKEVVPPVAAPRLGGTLQFWKYSLTSLQYVLENFCKDIQSDELRLQAHPHPISGPMDFQQRLEFLAFHIDRHHQQASRLISKK